MLQIDNIHPNIAQIILDVNTELNKASSKFGAFNNKHEGYAVILEELDELWDEIKKNPSDRSNMYDEAKQVAAMAIRFMFDLC